MWQISKSIGARRGFGIALLLIAVLPAIAQDRVAEAVNRSAHAQMLIERSTRSYAMLGQGVTPARTQRQLESDVAAFEADIAALRAAPLSPEQKQGLAQVAKSWATYRAAVMRPATLAGARDVMATSNELGLLTAKLNTLLRPPVIDRFDSVGLAGEARTYSQRLAKLYFYLSWGIGGDDAARQLKTVQNDYLVAMDKLKLAPQSDESTMADLALAGSQWVFFSSALAKLASGEGKMRAMGDVGKTSDAMLDILNGLAFKYETSKEQD